MRGLVAAFLLAWLAWAQAPMQVLFNTPADPEAGRKLWSANCAVCHGEQGTGGRGPDLTGGKFRHGSTDDDLYHVITNGIPGTEMPGFPLTGLESMQLLAYVRTLGRVTLPRPTGGDPARGRELFNGSGQCESCHRVGSKGARVGPDLSEVGARLAPADLLTALVRPDEHVSPEYWYVRVVTRDGQTVTGRRLNEDSYSVQLIDSEDQLVGLLKEELQDYQLIRRSLMPSYEGRLTTEQLSDLVAYLASLKEAR